ncbi:MAG: sigma-54 dependent transcriptional regulator [Syntrophaceae bacterium]|nr:sigma-54 dependent transcriptional regulator [Syntrophaceae bacterium]
MNSSMQKAIFTARQIAPTDAIVLLVGESGTGKTVLAKKIHYLSKRRDKPLAVISCPSLNHDLLESELFGHVKGAFTGAIRDNIGRIASCEGGTLLLDEIGELPLAIQSKLLRFLQDRSYERVGDSKTRTSDVRLIAATNVDLEKAVDEGKFRMDLHYRLNVIQIEIPPLRSRPEDIVLLAEMLLGYFGDKYHRRFHGFSAEAQKALRNYLWPGNIRELGNVIERAAILGTSDIIGPEHIPGGDDQVESAPKLGDPVALAVIEEEHIRRVLASTKSLQEAADILGIDQATLWRRRKQYRL